MPPLVHKIHQHRPDEAFVPPTNPLTPPVPSVTVGQKILSACTGSIITSLIVTPFDVVRVRLQQQSALSAAETAAQAPNMLPPHSKIEAPSPKTNISALKAHKLHPINVATLPKGLGVTACCKEVFWFPTSVDYCVASEVDRCAVEHAKQMRFSGTWQGMRTIYKYEGIQALWRGLSLTLMMAAPSTVLYFIGYEYLRDWSPIKSDVINPLVCGSLARTLSATVISPMELFRTRLQSYPFESSSHLAFQKTLAGMKTMVAQDGYQSLWRGLVLTLWRDVPFSGVYWSAYETFKAKLLRTQYFHGSVDAFTPSFIAGSAAGALASIITQPFDVGKTRRQIASCESAGQMSMIPLLTKMVREEGLGSLYVGAVPRILKVAPSCAIMISSYEVGKQLFDKMNGNSVLA
ncbi:Mitochondrial carrier protein [Yarrowia sp. B02]|nr:Mitochondrial carrier protein [Yarrowia sp. B02]